MTYKQIKHVPEVHYDNKAHARLMAHAINELIRYLIPNTGTGKVTGDTTLDDTYGTVFCDTDSAAITITLPVGAAGKKYRIINTGTSGNNITITPNGSELLLGVNSNYTLLDGDVLIIEYDTTEGWW